MNHTPNFARMTRLCKRCGRHKLIAGGRRIGNGGRGSGGFICADCESRARVIAGTGVTPAERKMTEALVRALKPLP